MPPNKVQSNPGSDVYHAIHRGRVKCGRTTTDYDHVMPIEEANDDDLRPCRKCFRSERQRERVASVGGNE